MNIWHISGPGSIPSATWSPEHFLELLPNLEPEQTLSSIWCGPKLTRCPFSPSTWAVGGDWSTPSPPGTHRDDVCNAAVQVALSSLIVMGRSSLILSMASGQSK